MIDRYDLFGRRMEDTEPDMLARFVRFDQHNDRIRELEAMLNEQQEHLGVVRADNLRLVNRIRELEATLRSVRTILQSDSIEYDDMRGMDSITAAALAGSALDRRDEP